MLRIGLFLATNLAVIVVLGLILSLTGINPRSTGGLMLVALVVGFSGSIISLLLSKKMALWSTGAQIITEPRSQMERWLVETVRRQAQASGIGMPDVAIYDAPEMNAFATGASRNKALVAVSTGLMQQMNADEVEAVLAHEVSHVANGDMVTMALIQGVLNTFVVFISRILAQVVDGYLRRDDSGGPGIGYFICSIVFEILFGILASIIAMWFSRQREFRADEGGARLAGSHKMIAALRRLQGNEGVSTLPKEAQAFGISGPISQGLAGLFRTHPTLDDRIAALQQRG
ncbi:MAG: protease HtpX [Xanthomonadales bacterium]|jgi:heat shock protein HtpX|nr:protease HtpX [Xanthomonadales bacterium]